MFRNNLYFKHLKNTAQLFFFLRNYTDCKKYRLSNYALTKYAKYGMSLMFDLVQEKAAEGGKEQLHFKVEFWASLPTGTKEGNLSSS